MKRYFTILIIIICFYPISAQKHEVGVFLGGTNAITDIGRTDYINPFPRDLTLDPSNLPLNFGVLYKYNLNPYHSLRFNLNYSRFTDDDKYAVEDYRYNRYPNNSVKYAQKIYESTLMFEYNFLPINSEQFRAHSPYIFAGLGALGYYNQKYEVVNLIGDDGNSFYPVIHSKDQELKFTFNVPFGVGYKYKFNYNYELGLEVGVRATLIDDLDLAQARAEDFTFLNQQGLTNIVDQKIINRSNQALISKHNIGDSTNHDWYVVTGLTFTYTFGRPACFCD